MYRENFINYIMHILLTGPIWHVAQHLIARLIHDGHHVSCFTHSSFKAFSIGHHDRLKFYFVNYGDLSPVRHVFESCDVVVHLAGRAHFPLEKSKSSVSYKYKVANVLPSIEMARFVSFFY